MTTQLAKWTAATSELRWGVQQACKTALSLVESEDISMCYNADVRNGSPCLVNAIHAMISESAVVPHNYLPNLVTAFDEVNSMLEDRDVNIPSGYVSPLAAQVLLIHFGELKPVPKGDTSTETIEINLEALEAMANGMPNSKGEELINKINSEPKVEQHLSLVQDDPS